MVETTPITIITVCDSPRQLGEMIVFKRYLPLSKLYVLAGDEATAAALAKEEITCTVFPNRVRAGRSFGQHRLQQLVALSHRLKFKLGIFIAEFLLGISHYLSSVGDRSRMSAVLREVSPDIILLESDRSLGLSSLLLAENSRGPNLPIIFSLGATVDLEGTLYNRRRKPATWPESYPSWVNRWWQGKQQSNLHAYSGTEGRYFYSFSEWIHLYWLKALPAMPWTVGSWPRASVLVPSLMQEEILVAMGTDRSKVVRMGSPELDDVFARFTKSQKANSRPRVIIAVPQLWEHAICSAEQHWSQVDALAELAQNPDYEVLFSLHPRMNRSLYESRLSNRILSKPLIEEIASADMLIASYSSTIPWAVLCGVPVVIVDLTGINVKTFDVFRDIPNVKSKEELLPAIKTSLVRGVSVETRELAGGDVFDGRYGYRLQAFMELKSQKDAFYNGSRN